MRLEIQLLDGAHMTLHDVALVTIVRKRKAIAEFAESVPAIPGPIHAMKEMGMEEEMALDRFGDPVDSIGE